MVSEQGVRSRLGEEAGVLIRAGAGSLGRAHSGRLPGHLTLLCRKRVILSGG